MATTALDSALGQKNSAQELSFSNHLPSPQYNLRYNSQLTQQTDQKKKMKSPSSNTQMTREDSGQLHNDHSKKHEKSPTSKVALPLLGFVDNPNAKSISFSQSLQNSPYNSTRLSVNLKLQSKGVEAFEAITKKKEVENQLKNMENRIKKLQDEEAKAIKKIQETIGRTKHFEIVKQRKDQDKQLIAQTRQQQIQEMENQRLKIQKERETRSLQMRELKIQQLEKRRRDKDSVNASIRHQLQYSMQEYDLNVEKKREMSMNIRNMKATSVTKRKDFRLINELENTERYQKQTVDIHNSIIQRQERVAELERSEALMLQKLQNTNKLKEDMFSNYSRLTGVKGFKNGFNSGGSQQQFSSTNLNYQPNAKSTMEQSEN